jgi:PAS domain S-box-containing protein
LQRELELRNCAMDAAASHFMILDMQRPHWPIVYVNRAILRDYGYSPQEVLGRSAIHFIATELCPVQIEQMNEAMRQGEEARTELRGRRKDGSIFWVGVFMGPIRDSAGVLTHYLLVGADISKRLEEEQQKRKLQDRLYSEMQERERMSLELQSCLRVRHAPTVHVGHVFRWRILWHPACFVIHVRQRLAVPEGTALQTLESPRAVGGRHIINV